MRQSGSTCGAHALVEGDGRRIPVQHAPLEAAAAARHRQRAQVLQQGLAQAGSRGAGGLHIQVFQVQPGPAAEGGEVGEEQRKAHQRGIRRCRRRPARSPLHRLHRLGHDAFGHRPLTEQVRVQLLGRGLHQVAQLLEFGQFADQADDGGHVARLGSAQGVGGVLLMAGFCHPPDSQGRRQRLQCGPCRWRLRACRAGPGSRQPPTRQQDPP